MTRQQIDDIETETAFSLSLQAEDEKWMQIALKSAKAASDLGEVPVGAVLVKDGNLIAAAGNQPILLHDPTAHAEIRVLRTAAQQLHNYRLPGSTLYVTLEPCLMCIGAIIHARVERLVYGATDPKTGAVCSLYPIGSDRRLNHPLIITSGILEAECSDLLRTFFQEKRAARKQQP
ncbi:tRNA adenosine(34) deaminase TadA [Desulfopila aestuarii]|uniref:tRNA-specific adenosine deaminase n=1 Tax=Desulfopila aestuarii DSM 18488 TaxID=1121416 RepID=A0A1M7YKJ3_9BACT|nr:tRNA adenosine(34) deaminase TadA [Desulfopila aestuarii]SHO53143.1 tRNA(adenine34) deaminase [Desulfopila aestuarii DSM 18488]